MNKMKRFVICLTIVLVCLAFPSAVFASDGNAPSLDDKVIFNGTFTLESGEVLNGNLFVFGGVVDIEEDALLKGDVVVFGGNVTVDGTVDGSLLAFGGVVDLNGTAIIRKDLIAPGTVVRKDENAQVYGQIITETELERIPDIPEIDSPEIVVNEPPTFWENVSYALRPVVKFFTNIVRALLFAAIALVVLIVLPTQGERVSNAIQNHTVMAGGFGLLSVFVFVFAVIVLALLSVTIILIPITVPAIILLSLGLAVGMLFGVIVVGAEVGRRITAAINQTWTRNIQVAIGTFALVFMLGLFNIALWDFFASIIWMVVGAIGLGAVLLTRFGTREYVASTPTDQTPADVVDVEPVEDDFDEDDIETMVRKRPERFKLAEEEEMQPDEGEEVDEDASSDETTAEE